MLPTLTAIDKCSSSRSQARIARWIEARRKGVVAGINIGCGLHPITGLTNIDKHCELAEIKADVSDLPSIFPVGVEHIEAHHIIEHLGFAEAEAFCSTCFKLLREDVPGSLVITCPDLTRVTWAFLRSQFCPWIWRDQSHCLKMLYGSQEHEGMFHKSGFTAKSLSRILYNSGFKSVFSYVPYPQRLTPSLCVIAER